MLSDPRLPLCVTDLRSASELAGRIVGHGEEETTGRPYMLIEGTDAKLHFAYHTADTETARAGGKVRPNSFVQIRRTGDVLGVVDFGDISVFLKNDEHFRRTARKLMNRGILPIPPMTGGWLGDYHRKLHSFVRDRMPEQGRPPASKLSRN